MVIVSWHRAGSKKQSRGSEQLVLDAIRSGMQFQKFIADAAIKVWPEELIYDLLTCRVSLHTWGVA